MKKRILPFLLCLCLLVGLLPVSALADSTWSVTYDGNGGTMAGGTTYTVGGITAGHMTIPELTPTRKNYVFLGWSAERSADSPTYSHTGAYNTRISLDLQENLTLYAVWEPEIQSITVSPSVVSLVPGTTITLAAIVSTSTGGSAGVAWTSSNTNVATVNKDTGKVTAISSGSATITASTGQSNSLYAVCHVTVENSGSVRLYSSDMDLWVEDEDSLDDGLSWSSDDPDIATVDDKGLVKGHSAGVTTLVAVSGSQLYVCRVTVTATVTLDGNGGAFSSGSRISQLSTSQTLAQLPAEVPQRDGFVFRGWAENEAASEAQYQPGANINVTVDTALYAVWDKELTANWSEAADTSWYSSRKSAFTLSTPEQLAGLAMLVSEGESFADATISLGADIDLIGTANVCHWTSIYGSQGFSGIFDGCGYTIRGLYIHETGAGDLGLFGYLRGAVIRNLGVSGVIIAENASANVGGIAGYAADSEILNCWSTVELSGAATMGGLCGYMNECEVRNCWFAGNCFSSKGFSGAIAGTVEDCELEDCTYLSGAANRDLGAEDGSITDINSRTATKLREADFVVSLNDWVADQTYAIYNTWSYLAGQYPDFTKADQWSGLYNTSWYDADEVTFTISTPEELAGLAELVNDGTDFKGMEVILNADISIGRQHEWTPIGTPDDPFCGIFDGRGHTIRGLSVNDDLESAGLFGTIKDAMLCNTGIADSCSFILTDDSSAVGGIVGAAVNSKVLNCWSSAVCETKGLAGGLVGRADRSDILNCWYTGAVAGKVSTGAIVGEAMNETSIAACTYLESTAAKACGALSGDSKEESRKLSEEDMKLDAMTQSLNLWVNAQNTDQYVSWKAVTDGYPAFDKPIVPVTAITLDYTTLRLAVEESKTLSAAVLPEAATFSAVTWTTSNEAVAKVDAGIVTGIGSGEVEITATAGNKNAVCKIIVGGEEQAVADSSCYDTAFAFTGSSAMSKLAEMREFSAHQAIDACKELGFTADAANYTFEPEDLLTREAAAELLCKAIMAKGNPASPVQSGFDDVAANRWSAGYIDYLTTADVMDGVTDTQFKPDTLITGNVFCESLLRAVGKLSLDGTAVNSAKGTLEGVTYRVFLDEAIVQPDSVVEGSYILSGTLVAGLAETGVNINAQLTSQVAYTIFLDSYEASAQDVALKAVNVDKTYDKTGVCAAYRLSGIEKDAVTKIVCSAPDIALGDSVSVVYYAANGKYSSAAVAAETAGEVSFTVKVFGDFIILPKAVFSSADWDPMQRFEKNVAYKGFTDVEESAWYGTRNQGVVQSAVQLGIMNGYTDGTFLPTGNIKLSEVVKMAAVVNDIFLGGKYVFDQTYGEAWYDTYVDYCITQNIIGEHDFSSYEATATRAQMAYIFAHALPYYEAINGISYSGIPDVSENTAFGADILTLYNAGILTGDASDHGFRPTQSIVRAEAAAIITRVALTAQRVTQNF